MDYWDATAPCVNLGAAVVVDIRGRRFCGLTPGAINSLSSKVSRTNAGCGPLEACG